MLVLNVRRLASGRPAILPAIIVEVASVPEVAESRAGTAMAATGGVAGMCRQWYGDRP